MEQKYAARLRFVRNPEVLGRLGYKSHDTLYRLEKTDPSFPKRVKLSPGGRATGFVEAEIDAYLEQRVSERANQRRAG